MRMGKLFPLWLLVAGLSLVGTGTEAGLYHTRSAGSCQDCHRKLQVDQAPALIATLASPTPQPRSFAPRDVTRTCLACHSGGGGEHDGSSVLAATSGPLVRQAGFLSGPTGGAHTGHTLGSLAPAPGGNWTPGPAGLTCTDCHDPHGHPDQYLNLVLRPGNASEDRRLTYTIGPVNDRQKDIWIEADCDGPGKYDSRRIRFNQPRAGRSAYAEWCQGCHAGFSGGAGAANMRGARGWMRHPTTDAPIGGGATHHADFSRYALQANRVSTMSASGRWPAPDNTPSCMSCHKSHGSTNPFGLLYMAGGGQLTESGDSQGKTSVDLCHQCHTQGLDTQEG